MRNCWQANKETDQPSCPIWTPICFNSPYDSGYLISRNKINKGHETHLLADYYHQICPARRFVPLGWNLGTYRSVETLFLLHAINKRMRVLRVWVMVFNATFNNIPVISLRLVLLVEETGVPGENHWPAASHWQTLSHNVVSSTPHHKQDSNSR